MPNYKRIGGMNIPAHWEICSCCNGEGKSSAYLGAYSREEFEESFDYEEQEAYFNGDYDRACETCKGSGKVLEVNYEQLNPKQKKAVNSYYDALSAERSERRMHDMGYQF